MYAAFRDLSYDDSIANIVIQYDDTCGRIAEKTVINIDTLPHLIKEGRKCFI